MFPNFQEKSDNIHICEEDGSTMLVADVRDRDGDRYQRKMRLDDHIGVQNGYLQQGRDFTQSVSDIRLTVVKNTRQPILSAIVEKTDGSWGQPRREMDLSEWIAAEDDGSLRWTEERGL